MSALSDQIGGAWERIDSYTTKTDARQTGFSMHIKFAKTVDVGTSLLWSQIMSESPRKLLDLAQRVEELQTENEAFRQAIRTGDGLSCEDVCLTECIGVCGAVSSPESKN